MNYCKNGLQLSPFGNWTRYILTVKDNEDFVFESSKYARRENVWWDVNFNNLIDPDGVSTGWIKINGAFSSNFNNWRTPFFSSKLCIYTLLRFCIKNYNYRKSISRNDQKEIWNWAFNNLIVYKITFNINTLTATKEKIDFKKDCCPKNISIIY